MSTVTDRRRTVPVKEIHERERKSQRKRVPKNRTTNQMTAEEFFSYYTLVVIIFLFLTIIWISMLLGGASI
jgi:uncharacterized membrane protein